MTDFRKQGFAMDIGLFRQRSLVEKNEIAESRQLKFNIQNCLCLRRSWPNKRK
jgi:hypothetical protein